MSTTTSCTTREAVVPQPSVRLSSTGWAEFRSIVDRLEDLTTQDNLKPSLRQANRLLLAYFLVLDLLEDRDQIAYKNCSLGKRMSRHCDAIYCALSYEFNSQDGDMGEMWVPLRTDVRRLLAHIATTPRAS